MYAPSLRRAHTVKRQKSRQINSRETFVELNLTIPEAVPPYLPQTKLNFNKKPSILHAKPVELELNRVLSDLEKQNATPCRSLELLNYLSVLRDGWTAVSTKIVRENIGMRSEISEFFKKVGLVFDDRKRELQSVRPREKKLQRYKSQPIIEDLKAKLGRKEIPDAIINYTERVENVASNDASSEPMESSSKPATESHSILAKPAARYGLQFGGLQLQENFADLLMGISFSQSEAQPGIWMRDSGGHCECVVVYTDELKIVSKNPKIIIRELRHAYR